MSLREKMKNDQKRAVAYSNNNPPSNDPRPYNPTSPENLRKVDEAVTGNFGISDEDILAMEEEFYNTTRVMGKDVSAEVEANEKKWGKVGKPKTRTLQEIDEQIKRARKARNFE